MTRTSKYDTRTYHTLILVRTHTYQPHLSSRSTVSAPNKLSFRRKVNTHHQGKHDIWAIQTEVRRLEKVLRKQQTANQGTKDRLHAELKAAQERWDVLHAEGEAIAAAKVIADAEKREADNKHLQALHERSASLAVRQEATDALLDESLDMASAVRKNCNEILHDQSEIIEHMALIGHHVANSRRTAVSTCRHAGAYQAHADPSYNNGVDPIMTVLRDSLDPPARPMIEAVVMTMESPSQIENVWN